ncbi:probable thiol methyltransferase 2 isoform X2 [Phalaenopsis equestris]|uniref:probable thiol methyltransferase 2 isoform X2 n=1 Tax=Phalaenopsis equestris TaxID=78828 RepID=UPI0009E3FF5E|nr:probable thiol methyltransferase 2 isoform X2 [Phalaenopsis equestris]
MLSPPGVANLLPRLIWTRQMAVNRLLVESAAKSPAVRVDGAGESSKPSRDPNLNPLVAKVRQLMSSGPNDGWEKCWEEGVTPWDLGQTTPIISHLIQTGKLPEGRILVPGCGTGYDVVAMASSTRFVVGLDVSTTAINKAKEFDDQEVGPPYNTSVADYLEVLNRVGFKAISIVDNDLAVKQRKGAEKLGRWKKILIQSSL